MSYTFKNVCQNGPLKEQFQNLNEAVARREMTDMPKFGAWRVSQCKRCQRILFIIGQ